MEKVVGGVVVAIIVIVGLYFGLGKIDDTSDEARQTLSEMCAELPAYARRDEYIEELIDAHHKVAFDRNYNVGGRRSPDSFDEASYQVDALERMAKQADLDKMDKIAEQLRGLRNDVLGISGD